MILKHIRFEKSKVNPPNEKDALLEHEYRSITKAYGNLMCIKNLAKTLSLSLGTVVTSGLRCTYVKSKENR